jgi:chromosome segregation ATPase
MRQEDMISRIKLPLPLENLIEKRWPLNQGVIYMSIPVSYDLAVLNIAQQVKFKEDINPKEARLGVWRFTHSLYYVSSSDCKIATLWFDFLKLIGLIVDTKDKKFTEVVDASANKFGQVEHIFNTQKYEDITKISNRLIKAKQILKAQKEQILQLTQEKATLSSKAETLSKDNEVVIKQIQNANKTISEDAQKQKQALEAEYSNGLKEKDNQIAQLKSQLDGLKGDAQKKEEQVKKTLQDQLAQKDKSLAEKDQVCKNFKLNVDDLQRDKAHLQDQVKAKDEQIKKMTNENAALLSEKKHNEKQHQDHAIHVVKLKDDHNRQIKQHALDTQEVQVQYKKAIMTIEDKDNEIKQLKAQIDTLKANNSVKIEDAAQ